MAWDPKTYLTFGAERTRPAAELLARVPIKTATRVADLGCGPGNSTEVLRGAILAVPVGQIEAARAFGMSPFKRWWRIIIPAMLPYAIPGLANLWLILTKDTALLAVVGYSELALETRQAAGVTKAYFTFYVAAGAIYLAITLLSNQLFVRLERHLRRGMPQHR